MVFVHCVMFVLLLSSSVMCSSEHKIAVNDHDFDIEAQCPVEQHQDYLDRRCAHQESIKINDGLDAIRDFVASEHFKQCFQRDKQNQVMPLSVRIQEQRRALWQRVMDEEVARRQALRQQIYFEKRDSAESALAKYGICLECDSDEEFILEYKDLAMLQDNNFLSEFLSLFEQNVIDFRDQVSKDVRQDMNVYLNVVAYETLNRMGINSKAHIALWNAIKIKISSSSVIENEVDLVKRNVLGEYRNQYVIAPSQKSSPASTAQINQVVSPQKTVPVIKGPAKKKLTPAQQAKEDAENRFLDEQIALQKKERVQAAELDVHNIAQKELSDRKTRQKSALNTKIQSLWHDNNSNQNQSLMAVAHSYAQKIDVADDLDADDISLDEFKARCKTKLTNDCYTVQASIPIDIFERFYKKTPELIALVKKYENKDAGALIKDPQFENLVNEFMISINIPAQQRVAMQKVFKESAALVWKRIARNCSKK